MASRVPPGRQRAAEQVTLNIYDLSPANDSGLAAVGLGFFHSGLEIHGREWTFSGSGIFSHSPRQAPGVKFRESIRVGEVRMSSTEVDSIVSDLRQDYPGSRYNILACNCNSFANELCMRLTGDRCPGYVNRLARLGNCVSCCLPRELTGASPVNDPSFGGGSSGRATSSTRRSFTGTGQTLGGGGGGGGGGGSDGSGCCGGRSGADGGEQNADDRRRLMRAAALARFEKKSKAAVVAPSEGNH